MTNFIKDPVLFAQRSLRAMEPTINMDGWSSDEILQEFQLAIATKIKHDFEAQRANGGAEKLLFEKDILQQLGYKVDALDAGQIKDSFKEAILASLESQKLRKDAQLEATEQKSLMIALEVNMKTAKELLGSFNAPGKELPEESHITLAYFGKYDKIPDESTLMPLLRDFAASYFPLDGEIGGAGRFYASSSSDGLDVIVALPDLPDLADLRQRLIENVEAAGVGIQASKQHGYTPHITLAYVPPTVAVSPTLPRVPLHFDAITVFFGKARYRFPLLGVIQPRRGNSVVSINGDGRSPEPEIRDDARRIWVKDPKVKDGGYYRNDPRAGQVQYQGNAPKLGRHEFVSPQEFQDLEFSRTIGNESAGINSALVVKDHDGQEYIMKQFPLGQGHAAKEAAAEMIATIASEEANIPCQSVRVAPPSVSSNVRSAGATSTIHEMVPGVPLRLTQEKTETLKYPAFISQIKTSSLHKSFMQDDPDGYLKTMMQHPDLAKIAALDMFLANGDRHANNLFYAKATNRFWAIDNGSAIPSGPFKNFDYSAVKNVCEHIEAAHDQKDQSFESALGLTTDNERSNLEVFSKTLDKLLTNFPKQSVYKIHDQMFEVSKPSENDADATKKWQAELDQWTESKPTFNQHVEVTMHNLNGRLRSALYSPRSSIASLAGAPQ